MQEWQSAITVAILETPFFNQHRYGTEVNGIVSTYPDPWTPKLKISVHYPYIGTNSHNLQMSFNFSVFCLFCKKVI